MFGEHIRILEDMSFVVGFEELNELMIIAAICFVLIFIVGIYILKIWMDQLLPAIDVLKETSGRRVAILRNCITSGKTFDAERFRVQDQTSIDRINKYRNKVSMFITILSALAIAVGLIFGMVFICILVDMNVRKSILIHRYKIEITGDQIPLDMMTEYEIIEKETDTIWIIQEGGD